MASPLTNLNESVNNSIRSVMSKKLTKKELVNFINEEAKKVAKKYYLTVDDSVRKIIRGVLKEFISDRELSKVEDYADDLFNPLGIDVEFTEHFRERLNDPRNRKQIETDELKDLFRKLYLKYGQKLPNFRKRNRRYCFRYEYEHPHPF